MTEKLIRKVTEIKYTPLLMSSDSNRVTRECAEMPKKRKTIVAGTAKDGKGKSMKTKKINKKLITGVLISVAVMVGLFAAWQIDQKPEITPKQGTYCSTSMDKMLSSLMFPIFVLGDSQVQIETPGDMVAMNYTIERRLIGKDVVKLSLPSDAASDAKDFDGAEFEILSDGELRAADKYATIGKDEAFELKEPIL